MICNLNLEDYASCPEYNAWLDDRYESDYGRLEILGIQPRPSFVLYSLSQETYQASFADFQQELQDELLQTVFQSFPSPIAYFFYRFEHGYEHEIQRLLFLRDTWEATVDVLHALAIGECRHKRIQLPDPIRFSHILSDKVAQRLLTVEQVISYAKDIGVSLLVSRVVTASTISTMRDLNRSRNAFSHSAAPSEAQARKWIAECYEDVLNVLYDMRELANVDTLRYLGQIDGSTLRCEIFKGYGLTKTLRNVPLTPDQLRESQRYFKIGQVLVIFGSSIFAVRPLIYYCDDASGHATRMCLFRRAIGSAPNRLLEFEIIGQAARQTIDRMEFQPELTEIRGLFGLGAD
jgi:hypothetical protein